MAEINFKAKNRSSGTKGERNKMRKDGFVPGLIYSKGKEPKHISIPEGDINKVVFTSESFTIFVDLEGQKEPLRCVVKAVQFDPITDKLIHFDLYELTAGEVVDMQVPVATIGTPKGETEGGIFQHYLHKLEIRVLPKNIPENLEVEVSDLGIGDTVKAGDLSYENIEILNPADQIICGVTAPQAPEEEDELMDEDEITEPEVIGKRDSDEDEGEDKE